MSRDAAVPLEAVIWDVDGTIAETERDGHRVAFNRAFEAAGLPWRWGVDEYGDLLAVAGGEERLTHDLARRAAAGDAEAPRSATARAALARALHGDKNARYATLVAEGGIALRPGVERVMRTLSSHGIAQAIATTTSQANVVALFDAAWGAGWERTFGAIVCAEEAPVKKPDPSVYRIALERLGVKPERALAIEDSPNGLIAARRASLATLVTRSVYFAHADFTGADATCDDLDGPVRWDEDGADRVDVEAMRRLHAASQTSR